MATSFSRKLLGTLIIIDGAYYLSTLPDDQVKSKALGGFIRAGIGFLISIG